MREILFRGRLKASGEWAYGCLKIYPDKEAAIITPDATPLGKYGVVDPDTIGQYTGLTDKNGVKIFEGDICEYEEENGIITWEDTEAMFTIRFDGWMTDFDHVTEKECVIIGNIHDNPELLEE